MLKRPALRGVGLYLLDLQNQHSRSGIPNSSDAGSAGASKTKAW